MLPFSGRQGVGSSAEREWGEVGAGGQGRTCGPRSSEAVRGPRHIRAVLNALTMSCTEATPEAAGRGHPPPVTFGWPDAGVSLRLTFSPSEHKEMQGTGAPGCGPRCGHQPPLASGWDPGEEGMSALRLKQGSPATPAPTRRAGSAWIPGSTDHLPLHSEPI